MGNKRKFLCLFLILMIFFQYGSTTVQALTSESVRSKRTPLYVVNTSKLKNIDRQQVTGLLKEAGINATSYTINQPIALFSVTLGELTENCYFPVFQKSELVALIRYYSETDAYNVEAAQVTKAVANYSQLTTNSAPLLLLEIDQPIIAKDEKNIYNFSEPSMSATEKEALIRSIDLEKIAFTNTVNLYEEREIIYEDSSQQASQIEETTVTSTSTDEVESTQMTSAADNSLKKQPSSQTDEKKPITPASKSRQLLPKKLSSLPKASIFPQSQLVELNQSVSGEILEKGEKKHYFFEVLDDRPAGTVYDEYIIYVKGNFNTFGTLYNSEGKVIERNCAVNENGDFRIVRSNLKPGIYYLEVKNYSGSQIGSFIVQVERDLGRDENYNFETAVSLALNTEYKERIDFAGDKDYYRFEVPEVHDETVVYDEYIMYAEGELVTIGTLYDSQGKVITGNDNIGNNFKIEAENLKPGIYYLKVCGSTLLMTGSYVVRVETEEDFNKKPIQLNSFGSYSGTIHSGETVKLYEFFNLNVGSTTIFWEHEFCVQANSFARMTLMDANHTPLETIEYNEQTLNSRRIQGLPMGKYYLEIKTNSDYSFSIHEKKLDNDYNRNFAEAELLRKEKTIDGTIDFGELATHEGDEDYFKLFIPGYYHGKYIIHLTGDTEVVGQLYNEQKESISEEFSQSLTKKLHPGLYFVKIRGKKANSQGDY